MGISVMVTRFAEFALIGCMTLAGLGAGNIVGERTKDEHVGMRLISIRYDNDMVTQSHEVYGIDKLQTMRTASVTRDRRFICSSAKLSPYEKNETSTIPLDDFIGDDCPELKIGDKIKAEWEWLDEAGAKFSVSGTIKIQN